MYVSADKVLQLIIRITRFISYNEDPPANCHWPIRSEQIKNRRESMAFFKSLISNSNCQKLKFLLYGKAPKPKIGHSPEQETILPLLKHSLGVEFYFPFCTRKKRRLHFSSFVSKNLQIKWIYNIVITSFLGLNKEAQMG